MSKDSDPKNKSLSNSPDNPAKKNVEDMVVYGNPDSWVLICKASSESEGWMKSTKAMTVGAGLLVQVTTQQRNEDGTYAIAEAICPISPACIDKDNDGHPRINII